VLDDDSVALGGQCHQRDLLVGRVGAETDRDEDLQGILVAQSPETFGGLEADFGLRVLEGAAEDADGAGIASPAEGDDRRGSDAPFGVLERFFEAAAVAIVADAVQGEDRADLNMRIGVIDEGEELGPGLFDAQIADGHRGGETNDAGLVLQGLEQFRPSARAQGLAQTLDSVGAQARFRSRERPPEFLQCRFLERGIDHDGLARRRRGHLHAGGW
jgi:hypothetical protein